MKNGNLVVIGAIAIVAIAIASRKKAAGLLNYFISGVAIRWDGVVPIMRIDLGIQNPSNQDFTIKSLVGNVTANGYQIANVSAFDTVQVKAASQVIYPIYLRLSFIGVVADIVNLITTGNGTTQSISFKGTVNASDVVAPIELNYKIL